MHTTHLQNLWHMKNRLTGYDIVKDSGLKLLVSINERWGFRMLDFTWKVFSQTGNIDTYLLFKELEQERREIPDNQEEDLAEIDFPIS
jgi:hypothetical protein